PTGPRRSATRLGASTRSRAWRRFIASNCPSRISNPCWTSSNWSASARRPAPFPRPARPAKERPGEEQQHMTTPANRILMGKIGAAHGIKGEVRLTSHTAEPATIASYGPLATDRPGLTLVIEAVRASGNGLVARLAGIADRSAAEALNGVSLFVERARLPPTDDEDDFYHAD